MKVYVAIYEHRHGTDTWAFATEELAQKKKEAIAAEWFETELDRPIPTDKTPAEIADIYFEEISERRGEYFTIDECEVIDA